MARDGNILTSRQLEVLELLAKGLRNAEIGEALGISPHTVKAHVAAVIDALGVSNRTEAAAQLEELRLGFVGGGRVPGFGERPLVAFLPLDDLVGGEMGWLAHGLRQDLILRMGGVRWFPVADRRTPVPASGSGADDSEPQVLIEGSVARENDRLVVTLRLTDTRSGRLAWAERFDRPHRDVLQIQSDMVGRIVAELEPAILRIERIRAAELRAEDIAVWDDCKRAEHALVAESEDGHAVALHLLERAVSTDPRSVRAWSGLALARASSLYLGYSADPRRAAAEARAAGERAVALVPDSFEARLALGRALALGRDHLAALPHLEAALEVNPSSAITCNTLAGALRREGETERAIGLYERTLAIASGHELATHAAGGLALAHLARGDYPEALRHAERAVAAGHEEGGRPLDFYPILPAALALVGRIDEARRAWEQRPPARPALRHSQRFLGPETEALVKGLRLAGWDGAL